MKMAELASLLLFALNTKKSYQIGTKNKILFYLQPKILFECSSLIYWKIHGLFAKDQNFIV